MLTLQPGTQLESYEILGTIGQGGMGAVYLARGADHQKVAIKEMVVDIRDPVERRKAVEQFASEAALLSRLDHTLLVGVHESFEVGGRHYMVMDFVDGMTLADLLEQRTTPPSVDAVLAWADQLCEVVHYLHTRDPVVIFRDLKPSNIMLDSKGQIRLIDFGIARVFANDTKTHTFIKGMGSKGFAPVEQYGAGTTDERTDVYSLGATLYNLLTLEKPPAAVGILAATDHLESPRKLNPLIPRSLEQAIFKMMAMQKDNRYATIAEVRELLSRIARGQEEDLTDELTGDLESLENLENLQDRWAARPKPPTPEPVSTSSLAGAVTTRLLQAARRPRNLLILVLVVLLAGIGLRPEAEPGPLGQIDLTPESGATALDGALAEGRPIRLAPGEYTIAQPHELRGDIEIVGSGRDKTRILCPAGARGLNYLGGGSLVVRDVSFSRHGDQTSNLVFVRGGRAKFTRCSFSGARRKPDGKGGLGQHGTGLRLGGKTTGVVQDCDSFDNDKYGMQVCEDARVDILDSRCRDNGWGGVAFLDRGAGRLVQSELSGNENGVVVAGNSDPAILTNLLEKNLKNGLLFRDFARGTAKGNRCLANGGAGIKIEGQAQPVISQNELRENQAGDQVVDER